MPLYESIFITRQDVSIQDVEKLTEVFSKIITDGNGKIVKIEQWGLRNLAYQIKKCNKGSYTLLCIDSDYDLVKEMERKMGLNEDLLRHMTIRVEAFSSEPSHLLKYSSSGDDDLQIVDEILQNVVDLEEEGN